MTTQTTEIDNIIASAEARMKRMAAARHRNWLQDIRRPSKRSHPKRHSENRERSRLAKAKSDRIAKHQKEYIAARKAFAAAARSYWLGQGDHS